mmetsp:Transcript_65688/g.186423  ORF Transcript_65688/g.186423 Transcript_65688/m.186423 type:complete len:230 (+) Transcript_65688:523-1212(+)
MVPAFPSLPRSMWLCFGHWLDSDGRQFRAGLRPRDATVGGRACQVSSADLCPCWRYDPGWALLSGAEAPHPQRHALASRRAPGDPGAPRRRLRPGPRRDRPEGGRLLPRRPPGRVVDDALDDAQRRDRRRARWQVSQPALHLAHGVLRAAAPHQLPLLRVRDGRGGQARGQTGPPQGGPEAGPGAPGAGALRRGARVPLLQGGHRHEKQRRQDAALGRAAGAHLPVPLF